MVIRNTYKRRTLFTTRKSDENLLTFSLRGFISTLHWMNLLINISYLLSVTKLFLIYKVRKYINKIPQRDSQEWNCWKRQRNAFRNIRKYWFYWQTKDSHGCGFKMLSYYATVKQVLISLEYCAVSNLACEHAKPTRSDKNRKTTL